MKKLILLLLLPLFASGQTVMLSTPVYYQPDRFEVSVLTDIDSVELVLFDMQLNNIELTEAYTDSLTSIGTWINGSTLIIEIDRVQSLPGVVLCRLRFKHTTPGIGMLSFNSGNCYVFKHYNLPPVLGITYYNFSTVWSYIDEIQQKKARVNKLQGFDLLGRKIK